MDTKTSGYALLFVGLTIMVFTVILVILAFTGAIHPSYFGNLFENVTPAPKNIDLNSLSQGGSLDLSSLTSSLNIIPPGVLDRTLNLTAHFLLMTFIGGFGYKIAMLGVNLLRPIVIKSGPRVVETQMVEDAKNS